MQMKTSVANGGGRNVQQKITMLISKLIQRIAVITKNRGATIPNFHASKKKQKSTKVTKKNFWNCLSFLELLVVQLLYEPYGKPRF